MQKSLWNQDGLAGLMFIAFGVLGLWLGRGYGMGTAMRMGPGAVPTILLRRHDPVRRADHVARLHHRQRARRGAATAPDRRHHGRPRGFHAAAGNAQACRSRPSPASASARSRAARSVSARRVILAIVLSAATTAIFVLGSRHAAQVLAVGSDGASRQPRPRFQRRAQPDEPAVLPGRRADRHADRRAAGTRARHHDRAAAAGDLSISRRSPP